MFLNKISPAFLLLLLTLSVGTAQAQEAQTPLSVEKIMRNPTWMGTSPSNIAWSEDGRKVYFNWNPDANRKDSLYSVLADGKNIRKVSPQERRNLPTGTGSYNRARTKRVYEKNGDIFLLDIKSGKVQQVTNTVEREINPSFTFDEQKVAFLKDNNLYTWSLNGGQLMQRTDFRKGKKPADAESKDPQKKWLREQQLELFDIIKERDADKKAAEKQQKADNLTRPKEIYIEEKLVDNVVLSPDEQFVTFRLIKRPADAKGTMVPAFVTASGYTEELNVRTKVGDAQTDTEFFVYDTRRDTTFAVLMNNIAGIEEQPAYLKDQKSKATATKAGAEKSDKKNLRATAIYGPFWSDNGKSAVVVARSADNKDRWILALDPASGKMSLLDRQHDDAWIGGPGIGYGAGDIGWLPDNEHIWFVSEESGYAHLYKCHAKTGEKRALTSGKFEVYNVALSADKKNWYFTSNKVHPGEQHFYRMSLQGGEMVQLTTQAGAHEVVLSPDEKTLAVRYSYTNKPWELYLMDNKKGARMRQVTNSLTDEFKAYNWRDPEVITFKARDGADVHARVYKPTTVQVNGPAVIFVHGAGYLQNAHKWWSSYFREYMFHNFLVDQGYTVLDIDYRGSAGYGRDVRTGIYQFMGGKDLSDHVDGARHLAEKYQVDPKRIGIYGGSYGGFITLMAMFTEPDVFAAGAALRSVTDWAHYNHGYTSNILNTPQTDSLAYAKSSPIYYADGLRGALLMCHGMVDTNVHFQDIVRLSQRLIELGKDNWELAVYPVEDHGFTEPASWTDEYKRIYKLFEQHLKP
ncbi:prolyl oligopeptidase family serine peptidase [Pontibacter qinzhouensis]|uniref:Prolyl oligopeptidase family serine peptidase n=1 Tax=Pontibacter qinzhouensis TaxID=2603253 RepID=A0A5C8K8C7_9BACT|nr:prolyl oligopeptidase family serine peptidase [Pontibacter qinzhouensis]TXK46439.1 prolyl oligopeptidase family serine peptidase [Pontibacter qinzhouensis]